MIQIEKYLLWSILALILSCIQLIGMTAFSVSSMPNNCDFEKYPGGCEDSKGSFCNREINKCQCKPDYPVRLFRYCLKPASIDEACFTSRQCNKTPNAACYILGTEYDHSGSHHVGKQLSDWPSGSCRCRIGHQYDSVNGTCIKRTIGSWCNSNSDCKKEDVHTYCNKESFKCDCVYTHFYDPDSDACERQQPLYNSKCTGDDECSKQGLVCTSGICRCPKDFHYNSKYSGSKCKPNNDTACINGYKWSHEWQRCVRSKDVEGENNAQRTGDDDLSITNHTVWGLALFFSGVFVCCVYAGFRNQDGGIGPQGPYPPYPSDFVRSHYMDPCILVDEKKMNFINGDIDGVIIDGVCNADGANNSSNCDTNANSESPQNGQSQASGDTSGIGDDSGANVDSGNDSGAVSCETNDPPNDAGNSGGTCDAGGTDGGS
ncbi:uncharacterized protein LOC141849009 [Brevipalpus obovatus]|uniref:uncharacterized protein LOC141849009 n=1 Tax=Brevipalpus obovatus TaxID=246614 RepID=UPI003D9EB6CB